MEKDPRLKGVTLLLRNNEIKKLEDIFLYIPAPTVADIAGITYRRLNKIRKVLALFTLQEIYALADLFEYDRGKMLQLIHRQANK